MFKCYVADYYNLSTADSHTQRNTRKINVFAPKLCYYFDRLQ